MGRRHPDWLKVEIGKGKKYSVMKKLLRKAELNTICEEAKCPNIGECFSRGTAVFLILGDTCTRNCKYCNVKSGTPNSLNPEEPTKVAESVKTLGLNYVVVTSVTRDDLKDGGASFFKETVNKIRNKNPRCKIEVLIPDFKGNINDLKTVMDSKPDVVNHNIEVVKDLFPKVRPQGDYNTSLNLLENIKKIDENIKSKSGLMIGLGEKKEEIIQTIKDVARKNVDFLTIGQYLQPTKKHAPIKKYYTPKEFEILKDKAKEIGFKHVEADPLVRSSYRADKAIEFI
ncbi:MAG: lipoyl synthase [Candidatus Thermoplasmatota archaeon]